MTPPRPTDRVFADLAAVMRQTFPDRDYSEPVTASTRVFADLGLASIDLVVLGEKLEQYYGRRLPFGPFLASLRNRGAEDLELGELIVFLQEHTN
jgi:acyl carrier protein